MEKGVDYKIKKIQVTALQRFKNQNALLKEFGESGLKTYKEIDNKKTAEEIREKLGVETEEFVVIIDFMEKSGMIELVSAEVGKKPEIAEKKPKEKAVKKKPKEKEIPAEEIEEETVEPLEEIEEIKAEGEPEEVEEIEPVEEEEPEEEIKPVEGEAEEESEEEEDIEPVEEEEPESIEEKIEPVEGEAEEESGEEEIEPIEEGPEPEEEIKPVEGEAEEESGEEEIEPVEEEEGKPEEVEPVEGEAEEESDEEEDIEPYLDDEIEPYSEEEEPEEEEETSVERIIRDKYGAIGIAVYTLIDGDRSAEEIMKETGLTEAKLVEILDFMEEKGVIKLEYPGRKEKTAVEAEKPVIIPEVDTRFAPLTDNKIIPTTPKGMKTIDVPVKLTMDIVKSVQLKAKIMLGFGDKGSAIFESIDGKRNIIDIVLKKDVSLEFVMKIVNFLLDNNAVLLKPLAREQIHDKFGIEAYRVYKKFGIEGVLLYELIGKEGMTIKQMMKKVTKDKQLFVDMFVFIHKVLNVPIPIERDILLKRLED